MEKALQFLAGHKDVALATSENNRPKVRVFQIMLQKGTDFYFATSANKEIFVQLQQNPYIEFVAMAGSIMVRVAGKAYFDVDDATASEIYTQNPVLQRFYDDYRSLAYFRVPMEKMDYYDLATTPVTFESYASQTEVSE